LHILAKAYDGVVPLSSIAQFNGKTLDTVKDFGGSDIFGQRKLGIPFKRQPEKAEAGWKTAEWKSVVFTASDVQQLKCLALGNVVFEKRQLKLALNLLYFVKKLVRLIIFQSFPLELKL
jgi:hypothetical protein